MHDRDSFRGWGSKMAASLEVKNSVTTRTQSMLNIQLSLYRTMQRMFPFLFLSIM